VEILAVAPHNLAETRQLVATLELPFPVLADEQRSVFRQYDVQSRAWSLGQRPGLYLIDRQGRIFWAHLGRQQWEIPSTDVILAMLDRLPGHEGSINQDPVLED
jgi:peroxiredoxin